MVVIVVALLQFSFSFSSASPQVLSPLSGKLEQSETKKAVQTTSGLQTGQQSEIKQVKIGVRERAERLS